MFYKLFTLLILTSKKVGNIELNLVIFSKELVRAKNGVGVFLQLFSRRKYLENKNLYNIIQQKQIDTAVKHLKISRRFEENTKYLGPHPTLNLATGWIKLLKDIALCKYVA